MWKGPRWLLLPGQAGGVWLVDPVRTWPPRDLGAYSQNLRILIAADRKRYGDFRQALSAYPVLWELAGRLLKTRARYYRGEIIRGKQDTRRYALGENPEKPSRYGQMVCDWANQYLYDLPEQIASLEEHWSTSSGLGQRSDPRAIVTYKLYEGDEASIELTKKNMEGVIKDLERLTYGGPNG